MFIKKSFLLFSLVQFCNILSVTSFYNIENNAQLTQNYYETNCSNIIKSNSFSLVCSNNDYNNCCENIINNISIKNMTLNKCYNNLELNTSLIYTCDKLKNSNNYIIEIFCIIGYMTCILLLITIFILILKLCFKKFRKRETFKYDPL